jgi:hypothetical protein
MFDGLKHKCGLYKNAAKEAQAAQEDKDYVEEHYQIMKSQNRP